MVRQPCGRSAQQGWGDPGLTQGAGAGERFSSSRARTGCSRGRFAALRAPRAGQGLSVLTPGEGLKWPSGSCREIQDSFPVSVLGGRDLHAGKPDPEPAAPEGQYRRGKHRLPRWVSRTPGLLDQKSPERTRLPTPSYPWNSICLQEAVSSAHSARRCVVDGLGHRAVRRKMGATPVLSSTAQLCKTHTALEFWN